MTPALLLLGLIATQTTDETTSPTATTTTPATVLHQSSTAGFIVNPLGLWLRHDLAVDTRLLPTLLGGEGVYGDLRVGGFAQWLVYSTEFGVRLSWLTKPELLILASEAAVDAGRFIEEVDGKAIDLDVRVPHVRVRLSTQALVNVKLDEWWFYSRSTAALRLRNFVEVDPYQNLIIEDELDLEQATALMKRLFPLRPLFGTHAATSQLWLYGEYTVGVVVDLNADRQLLRPHRVSLGFIAENFPARGAALNLDVFWSFTDAPQQGPGVIALYGFAF